MKHRWIAITLLAAACSSEPDNPEGCPATQPSDAGDPCDASLDGTTCQYDTSGCGLTTYACEPFEGDFSWVYQSSEDCSEG
jgi:hypothetical protein